MCTLHTIQCLFEMRSNVTGKRMKHLKFKITLFHEKHAELRWCTKRAMGEYECDSFLFSSMVTWFVLWRSFDSTVRLTMIFWSCFRIRWKFRTVDLNRVAELIFVLFLWRSFFDRNLSRWRSLSYSSFRRQKKGTELETSVSNHSCSSMFIDRNLPDRKNSRPITTERFRQSIPKKSLSRSFFHHQFQLSSTDVEVAFIHETTFADLP